MHSIEYGYAPTSFSAVWPKHKARNLVYELRSHEHYVMPNPYIEMFNNSLRLEMNSAGNIIYHNNKKSKFAQTETNRRDLGLLNLERLSTELFT